MSENARVLLVDDSVADATLTTLTLMADKIGCSIEHATDGYIGLAKLTEAAQAGRPYTIVVLDVNMPGLKGCDVLGKIRASEELGDTFVAILTTGDCETLCSTSDYRCKAYPANIYLHKEANLDDFEAELLHLKQAYEEYKATIIDAIIR